MSCTKPMKQLLTLILILFYSVSSRGQETSTSDTSNDRNGGIFSYTNNLRKQLNLTDLTKGFDGIDIRIWYIVGPGYNEIYDLRKVRNKWKAYHRAIYFTDTTIEKEETRQTEYLIKHNVKKNEEQNISFKSNPDSFFYNLKNLGIDTLNFRENYDLEDMELDGRIFCFEVGEQNKYNYYDVVNISIRNKKYKQIILCAQIIDLMEKEFDVKSRRKSILLRWNKTK